jgi:hypothetical protein
MLICVSVYSSVLKFIYSPMVERYKNTPYHVPLCTAVLSSREVQKLVTSIFGAQRWAF